MNVNKEGLLGPLDYTGEIHAFFTIPKVSLWDGSTVYLEKTEPTGDVQPLFNIASGDGSDWLTTSEITTDFAKPNDGSVWPKFTPVVGWRYYPVKLSPSQLMKWYWRVKKWHVNFTININDSGSAVYTTDKSMTILVYPDENKTIKAKIVGAPGQSYNAYDSVVDSSSGYIANTTIQFFTDQELLQSALDYVTPVSFFVNAVRQDKDDLTKYYPGIYFSLFIDYTYSSPGRNVGANLSIETGYYGGETHTTNPDVPLSVTVDDATIVVDGKTFTLRYTSSGIESTTDGGGTITSSNVAPTISNVTITTEEFFSYGGLWDTSTGHYLG